MSGVSGLSEVAQPGAEMDRGGGEAVFLENLEAVTAEIEALGEAERAGGRDRHGLGDDGFVAIDGLVAGERPGGHQLPIGTLADQAQHGGHGDAVAVAVDGGQGKGGFGAGVDGAVEFGLDPDEAGGWPHRDGGLRVAGAA